MIILAFAAAVALQQCTAFVHPSASLGVSLRHSEHRVASSAPAAGARPSLSALRMAKKGAGSGPKRKKKKAAAASNQGPGAAAVSEQSVDGLTSATDGLEDAGGSMMSGGGFGSKLLPGELLAEGSVGTDEAREAKIEETLRKMGVKGIEENREKAKENKSVGDQITSIFDVIPAETQLVMERVFIAGFVLCLLFLVGCGGAIGTEAYFLSTNGKLPPDLDNFIVTNLEPLFTPSLVATFAFSSALGVLKLGQMGQESIVYKEDD